MVFLTQITGVRITICIEGLPATEYKAKNDKIQHKSPDVAKHQSTVTTTKYIQSITGREFSIKLESEPSFDQGDREFQFCAYVDGKPMTPILVKGKTVPGTTWYREILGPYTFVDGAKFVRPLTFARIIATSKKIERSEVEKQKEILSQVGSLTIRVHEVTSKETKSDHFKDFRGLDDVSDVHEEALGIEAKSHGAVLGDARRVDYRPRYDCKSLHGVEFPLAIVHFKYRSRIILQSLGIMPKEPSPEPNKSFAFPIRSFKRERDISTSPKALQRKRSKMAERDLEEPDELIL